MVMANENEARNMGCCLADMMRRNIPGATDEMLPVLQHQRII